MSTKENDGRGARRKYLHYALVVAGLFGCMFLISLVGQRITASPSSYDRKNTIRKQRHGLLNHHMRHAEEEEEQQQQAEFVGGSNKRRHFLQRPITLKTQQQQKQQQADNDDAKTDTDDHASLQGILEGRLHLINIRPMSGGRQRGLLLDKSDNTKSGQQLSSYRGLFMASFCHLDWSLPKTDPSTTPMFRWLVDKSPDCNNAADPYEVDLYDIVQKVQEFDAQNPNKVKLLNLTGVVFHESRCGSTLVANVLAAMNPAQHRVYSESSPPIIIMRLAEGDGGVALSVPQAAAILKHVVYLMSRSDDMKEERVFFKIQSIGTRSLNVFQHAFPTTPWIFVYRDPVQVMMSHLGKIRNPRQANCVRPQQYPAAVVEHIVSKYNSGNAQQDARDLSYQDFCAAHLASLTETALEHMLLNGSSSSNDNSIPVNYAALPDIMWTDILPNHWHVPTGPDEIQRMQLVATQYSKQGKGGPGGDAGGVEFTGDSKKKDEAASPAIRMAAQRYLQPSFEALEKVAAARRAKLH